MVLNAPRFLSTNRHCKIFPQISAGYAAMRANADCYLHIDAT